MNGLATSRLAPALAVLLLAGCARLPVGPSVMVLPGNGKDFAQFANEDALCRQWAAQQSGAGAKQAADKAAVGSVATDTALGAASGAAIGAAAGAPGVGAAVGSGVGVAGGSAVGAGYTSAAEYALQRRYDIAYMQCMYASGNLIPMPRGVQYQPAYGNGAAASEAPPPPPAGRPPPPPR